MRRAYVQKMECKVCIGRLGRATSRCHVVHRWSLSFGFGQWIFRVLGICLKGAAFALAVGLGWWLAGGCGYGLCCVAARWCIWVLYCGGWCVRSLRQNRSSGGVGASA